MTWTHEHSILLARKICGYEVQTSPKGVHYVIEDGRTRPLPDFPNDPGETLTTLEAWLTVQPNTDCELMVGRENCWCRLSKDLRTVAMGAGSSITKAISEALYVAVRK